MSSVSFSYQSPFAWPKQKRALKEFLLQLATREGHQLENLSFVFCSDRFLLGINRSYLNHDDYTDIITFNLGGVPGIVEGEIYISVDRVRENAKLHGEPLEREVHRLIFHGLLHLCGYKDKLNADQQVMRQKEDFYLARYFR
jgi:probable rRNA maturation factor